MEIPYLKHSNTPVAQELIDDKEALANKNAMMKKLKLNRLLISTSHVCNYIGGPLVATGMIAALTMLFGGAAGIPVAAAVGMLGAGTAFVATSIACYYTGNKIFQGHQIDNLELNAQSTAHHLVEELKENSMCMEQHHEHHKRKDGKSWADTVQQQESSRGQSLH